MSKGENHPDLNIIRKILFWDTDFEKIDWEREYIPIIKRVLERGKDVEKEEIKKFYGEEKIKEVLTSKMTLPMSISKKNPNTAP